MVFFSIGFSNIQNIPLLVDTSSWPKDDLANFGDKEINELLIILMPC